jgi:hypothetical protein
VDPYLGLILALSSHQNLVMNLAQLKKNVGHHVQLAPPAIHLDGFGRELPCRDEDWIIADVTDQDIRLHEALVMGLTTQLGSDGVHHYTRNPSRSVGATQYGFLVLNVQAYIQAGHITYRPTRPGERLAPPPVSIERTAVDFNYPSASGIQKRLESHGWQTGWVRESRLPSLELEGAELVIEKTRRETLTSFYLRDPHETQVYIKKRNPDPGQLANNAFFREQPGLKECSIDPGTRTLVLRFDGPLSAGAFLFRMSRGNSGLRCVMMPGRIDTALVHVGT